MCHAYGLHTRDTINTFNEEDGQSDAQEHLRWPQQSQWSTTSQFGQKIPYGANV